MRRVAQFSLLLLTLVGSVFVSRGSRAEERRQRDLYLASRDEIQLVEKIVGEIPTSKGGTFVGIIGGMAALNFFEKLRPAHILLVDLNPAQVQYGRCIIEQVKLSATREEFVSAFFSRPFQSDEATFLAQPGDRALLDMNTDRIKDKGLRESCKSDLGLIADATWDAEAKSLLVARNTNGKFLQLRGPEREMPIGYNFLYFDRGWLASDASYEATRAVVRAAKIRFLASDIGAVPVKDLRGKDIVFWGSNLATWFKEGREAYERFIIRAHEEFLSRNEAIRFTFSSTYRRSVTTTFLPFEQLGAGVHLDASAKVRKHAAGKVVLELIPGRAYFGKELKPKDNVVQNASVPIDPAATFDVAVLHILNNSGMKWWREDRETEFRALYENVLGRANEVVILEHNRMSPDFTDKERARMVGMKELLDPIFPLLAKRRFALGVEPSIGETDPARNFVLHVKKL